MKIDSDNRACVDYIIIIWRLDYMEHYACSSPISGIVSLALCLENQIYKVRKNMGRKWFECFYYGFSVTETRHLPQQHRQRQPKWKQLFLFSLDENEQICLSV